MTNTNDKYDKYFLYYISYRNSVLSPGFFQGMAKFIKI